MKFRTCMWNIAMCLFAALAITLQPSAQDNPVHKPRHHQYKLYDLGTFGGPNSSITVNVPNLNSQGMMVGLADTPVSDPYSPHCFASILDINLAFNTTADCHVTQAFSVSNGNVTNLGSLPGGEISEAVAVSDSGVVAGISENGSIDPLTGYPQIRAVAWHGPQITDLGTLGGNVSAAFAVSSRGDVVGAASNAISDPFASYLGPCFYPGFLCWPVATQLRAFRWRNGVMQDLGTLGGNDAYAAFVNESGEVAGASFTNTTPNLTTGVPTVDSFLWKNGKMTDLGTLGGTLAFPYGLNNRGQVVGVSSLPGDQVYHPFLWDRGVLTDLGSLGGTFAQAQWINDAGDVVGQAYITANQDEHAFSWSHGQLSDLGTIPGDSCSAAYAINARGQVVGVSGPPQCQGTRASLWEGGSAVDLNTLVNPNPNVRLYWAITINDRGEIGAMGTMGVFPNNTLHAYLLVPDGDCDSACEQRIVASQNTPPVLQPATTSGPIPTFGRPADWLRNPTRRPSPMFVPRPGPAN